MEIFLAWFGNLQGVALAVLIVALFTAFVMAGPLELYNEQGRLIRRLLVAATVSAVVLTVPTPGDLWKVRLALLKLDLASPENAAKVGGHIENVVRALECKHLNVNCPQPEKESK